MKRFVGFFSAVSVLLWVLPLGSFIKPSQEKSACNGNRAFHMCSMMSPDAPPETKVSKENSGKVSMDNASAAERQTKSSAGGGSDWTLRATPQNLASLETQLLESNALSNTFYLARSTFRPPEIILHS